MSQHGAYMLLLWEYYINGPILADARGLLNICCGRAEADEVDVNYVLERFFVLKDGFWRHSRADEEIEKRASVRKRLQLNGKRGGLAKASHLLQPKASEPLACSQSQSHIKPITPSGETPDGLHSVQYAVHICDELAIPKKGNMETVSECVEVLAKSRKCALSEAHDYLLARALAAKEAGETVNTFWFKDGKYNITKEVRNDGHKTATQLRNERNFATLQRALAQVDDSTDKSKSFLERTD